MLNNPNAREGAGRADIAIMNLIGFHASAFGNHEFDLGTSFIGDLIGTDVRSETESRWLGTQFPYLSANLDFSGDGSLSGLYTDEVLESTAFASPLEDSEAAANAPKIARSAIVTINNEQFGIVGGTTPMLETISSPGDTKIKNPGAGTNDMDAFASIIQPVVDELTAKGINKIILTTHLQQIQLEKELITKLKNVDIVIAGGSDTLLADSEDVERGLNPGDTPADTYPVVTTNADGDPAVVVSTDGQYSYVGRLVVTFDKDGKLKTDMIDASVSGAFASTDAVVASLWGDTETPFAVGTKGHDVKTLTDAVNTIVIAKDGVTYGSTSVYLNGARENVRTEETNLGNLTADANLAAAKAVDAAVLVSIKNGGGIRASIGETVEVSDGVYENVPPQANAASGKQTGQISQLDIENALKFNNKLSLVTVTAAGLLEIIEHGVSATEEGATPGQFPQVGGIAFSFDPSRAAGDRVMSLVIQDENGSTTDIIAQNGEVVGDSSRTIRVVTLNFMAAGGDGYPFDTLGTNLVDTDIGEQTAMADYLTANYAATAYGTADTDRASDTRIQNLAYRSDTVISDMTTFAVFSDPHYSDADLGTTGSAFEAYLMQDRKLLRESAAILDSAVSAIQSNSNIDFVIVPGDLTKDGERTSHEKFAAKMKTLEDSGIQVFVVPGNHDINNPHAVRFDGDTATQVATVTPAEFAQIYANFGYGDALYRDPNSLSYVAEPMPDLWLFGMDACQYGNNLTSGTPETAGAFSEATLNWITGKLAEAKSKNKKIIGFMHHGLLEHYTGQSAPGSLGEEYVIEHWATVSETLGEAGLSTVFTGHYHASDITEKTWEKDGQTLKLTDVETGSLVTWPCPYRIASVGQSGSAGIQTNRITEINYDTGDLTFQAYAEKFLEEGLTALAAAMLTAPADQGGYGVTQEQAAQLVPYIVAAYKAHYAGDESPDAGTLAAIGNFMQSEDATVQLLGQMIGTLWSDLTPSDSSGSVSLDAQPYTPEAKVYAFAPLAEFPISTGVAEIVVSTPDGEKLLYTNSSSGTIGMINISDPAKPVMINTVDVTDGENDEPTSAAITPDGKFAMVVVRTGDDVDNANPGWVRVYNIEDPANITHVTDIAVGIGPDSIAIANTPVGDATVIQALVAIEDEEDEDNLSGARAGRIDVIKFNPDDPTGSTVTSLDVTAHLAGLDNVNFKTDPQPEFVAVSPDQTMAAVTIQENNAVAILDISNPDAPAIKKVFSAGSVTRTGNADLQDNKEIDLSESFQARREPDGIYFMPDGQHIVTANEGDTALDTFGDGVYSGGRNFTVFDLDGSVTYEPGGELDEKAVMYGHYPDERSAIRGIEVEGITAARIDGTDFVFAASERGSFVVVYKMTTAWQGEFLQFLPTDVAPEGIITVSGRSDGRVLLVTANEEFGTLNIIEFQYGAYAPPAAEPKITSTGKDIPWGALSGMTTDGSYLYAVPDNAFGDSRIYRIVMDDITNGKASIDQAVLITKDGSNLQIDPEGIIYFNNGFWVASEGATPDANILYRVSMDGAVQEEIAFPTDLLPISDDVMDKHGYEGVDISSDGRYIYAAVQRGFLKSDAYARILRYDTSDKTWISVKYPMDEGGEGWMGISEITLLDDDATLLVVERDKGAGNNAVIKKVYEVDVSDAANDEELAKVLVSDLLDKYKVLQEKIECMTVFGGNIWIANDNDGAGETRFVNVGSVE